MFVEGAGLLAANEKADSTMVESADGLSGLIS
jgi:hypothetical protein